MLLGFIRPDSGEVTINDLDTYKKTPFILDKNSPDFSELFPLLKNPNFKLDHTQKPLYHAACVMSNNFTTILWEHAFEIFSDKLQIPKQALIPILEQTCLNLSDNNLSVQKNDFSHV